MIFLYTLDNYIHIIGPVGAKRYFSLGHMRNFGKTFHVEFDWTMKAPSHDWYYANLFHLSKGGDDCGDGCRLPGENLVLTT